MEFNTLESMQNFWEKWGIRASILGSLFLQCFLILVSPMRKRSASIWMYMMLWSAYLMADWVANYVVGQISSSQSDKCSSKKDGSNNNNNADLLAFWAPFLLVHLGGPDTISAFALEDNELWRRHLLTLVIQSVSAGYVFFLSLPKNVLLIPTVCMFISGVVKYAERTRALLLASVDCFRDKTVRDPDPGPNYAKLMNEYYSMNEAHLPTSIKTFTKTPEEKSVNVVKKGRLNDTEVVLYAHEFFEKFKGVIVDMLFSFRERDSFRKFFQEREAVDAFKLIEVELNFIYDVFFTKVSVLYWKWGYVFRFISSFLAVASLGLFYFEDKGNFNYVDVAITYTLLIGAIVLDIIAFIMLVVSDWRTVNVCKLPAVNIDVPEKASEIKNDRNSTKRCFLRRRWSESMSASNLIRYARRSNRSKVAENIVSYLGIKDLLDGLVHVERQPFTEGLRDHIFKELKEKSKMAGDDLREAKNLSQVRGEWILRVEARCDGLLPYILKKDYDESVLLWHIATELCHQNEQIKDNEDPFPDNSDNVEQENEYKKHSKLLSGYMLYLLVMQRPSMLSTVAGIGQIRFNDTSAEAQKLFGIFKPKTEKAAKWIFNIPVKIFHVVRWVVAGLISPLRAVVFFISFELFPRLMMAVARAAKADRVCKKVEDNYMVYMDEKNKKRKQYDEDCEQIWNVHTDVEPVTVKGDKSKSVLFEGCILAKELMKMENKWRVISKVWVEMMCYAAINCPANKHTQQLSRGGELLTLVWILMIQLGLGSQFQISEGHERAKLHVGK